MNIFSQSGRKTVLSNLNVSLSKGYIIKKGSKQNHFNTPKIYDSIVYNIKRQYNHPYKDIVSGRLQSRVCIRLLCFFGITELI